MAKLFGKSPFVPLQLHLDKISDCVEAVGVLLEKIRTSEEFDIGEEARVISKLEHKADLVKNDIRNNLPRGLFMAIDRGQLLEIVSLQDSIADQAEDIAVLMSIRPIKIISDLSEQLKEYIDGNLNAFYKVKDVMRELDALIESGFGGTEANRVNAMIEEVAIAEHECVLDHRTIYCELFA